MKRTKAFSVQQMAVLSAAALLFIARLTVGYGDLTATQNGTIRFFLGTILAILILLRPKTQLGVTHSHKAVLFSAVVGTISVLAGMVLEVNQFEWLGFLLVLLACLQWALPLRFKTDISLALLLLYWVHPLPNQLFAPLQLAMQGLSTSGSEWVLHLLNVRAWASGFVIYTTVGVYEVPSWCSGMRTATTIMVLSLGLSILWRMRWYECIAIIAAALAQALALNIARISAMVILVPPTATRSHITFLHDATGIIVASSVFLLVAELSVWRYVKRRYAAMRAELNQEYMPLITPYPPFWRILGQLKWTIVAAALLFLAIGLLAYKNRPFHRAAMIKDVAVGLRNSRNLDTAQVAADAALELVAEDKEWALERIRLMLARGKFDQVLVELTALEKRTSDNPVGRKILRAYALMGKGQITDAVALVNTLPERARKEDASVAMILAEISQCADNPDSVARNITIASRAAPNSARIRALYPYLHKNRRWDAIVDSNIDQPYSDPAQALAAIEACMNLDRTAKLASLLRQSTRAWPEDPRLLVPLFFMVIRTLDNEWETSFARHVARYARSADDIDALYEITGKCFYLGRPDLAWLIYHRIAEIDPTHPTLPMMAVRHGDQWFSFRSRHLGFNSSRWRDKADIRSFFLLGRISKTWLPLVDFVPLGNMLCGPDTVAVRKEYLEQAIVEFEHRDAKNRLSLAMQYEYVRALEIRDGPADAKQHLDTIPTKFPGTEAECLVILSEMYEKRGDWGNVYETLRNYLEQDTAPEGLSGPRRHISPMLRLCVAQMNLRLGLAAIRTARQAATDFPASDQATFILAMALGMYDSAEEALFVLNRPRIRRLRYMDMLEGEMLFQTHRLVEARNFCRSVLLPHSSLTRDEQQTLFLPPAELAVLWHKVATPSYEEFAENAELLRANIVADSSPFVRDLMALWLKAYDTKCAGDSADRSAWLSCGRTRFEAATALNHLTMLLCRFNKFNEARDAAADAVQQMPESPTLWRALISLSKADEDVIETARQSCPTDSEIWLAELVYRTHISNKPWSEDLVLNHLAQQPLNLFTPAALSRAAHYLFRGDMFKAATVVARSATDNARGLLPAHVIDLLCAIQNKDKTAAIAATRNAINASLVPAPPLYEELATLRTGHIDSEMVHALRNLRRTDSTNPEWSRMLGQVLFERGGGDVVDAFYQMKHSVDRGATNKAAYVVAAEASRLVGNIDRATNYLHNGLVIYPGDTVLLNNLAYTLASKPHTALKAVKMVPGLLANIGRAMPMLDGSDKATARLTLSVLDTISMIHLRTGERDKAQQTLQAILSHTKQGTPIWFRATLRTAELLLQDNRIADAETTLKEAFRYSKLAPNDDLLDANALLAEINAIKLQRSTSIESVLQMDSPEPRPAK